jgi:hypothetical protein
MEARGFASRTHEFITVVLAALIGADHSIANLN